MESVVVLRSPLNMSIPHNFVLRPSICLPICARFNRFTTNFRLVKSASSSHARLGGGMLTFGTRKCFAIRASASSESTEPSSAPVAPLQLESPAGQFLSQILVTHPHLLPAAAEQQLEQLQTDLESDKLKEEPSASGTELVLYRIAEVKANERRRALEEILYTLVVQKFMDANIALVPSISPSSSDPTGRVDTWHSQDEKLEKVHTPEAYEMIQNHLALILGNRLDDSSSVTQISKLRVGQVYAASVMYGYFLKRMDQRFQLEKSMKLLRVPEPMEEKEKETIEQGTVDDPISYQHQ